MKVLLLAFGNPDNVLTLARNISSGMELTVVFAVSGNRFRQGVMDIDLSGFEPGLITDSAAIGKLLHPSLNEYIGGSFNLWFLKTQSRKFLHKSGGLKNYLTIRKASRELSSYGFDIVHFNGTSGFLLYLLKHVKCRKRLWTLHDYKPHTGEENLFGTMLNRVYTKFNLRYIQHYKFLKDGFADYYNLNRSDIYQVYSGSFDVYAGFNPVDMKLPERYVLFIGRFSKYKGLDLLFPAFRNVGDKDLHLIAAGDGDAGIGNIDNKNIMLINRYISPEELVTFVKNAVCIITPYLDSTHSGVIMTAYAFDKPVISSDVGGIKEVLLDGETGILFEAGNAKQLTEAIEKISGNGNLSESMSGNIAKLKSEGILNWKKIAEEMTGIYSSL